MGVQIREKPKGSGIYWVFINHHGRRKSKKVGDKKTANGVAEKINAKLVLGEFKFEEKEDHTAYSAQTDHPFRFIVTTHSAQTVHLIGAKRRWFFLLPRVV